MDKNLVLFIKNIKKLCKKHKILLAGKIRVLESDKYIPDTQTIESAETIEYPMSGGTCTDRMGPFLIYSAQEKPAEAIPFERARYNSAMLNVNKDKLLENGVKSTIDGSVHTNRKTYNDHLKAHGCREVGNDYNNAKPKWDTNHEFDDRGIEEATARAVDEVFDRKKITTLR